MGLGPELRQQLVLGQLLEDRVVPAAGRAVSVHVRVLASANKAECPLAGASGAVRDPPVVSPMATDPPSTAGSRGHRVCRDAICRDHGPDPERRAGGNLTD